VGFLLNSSRILKDFRKIQYVMPCSASYARLFLKRFLYVSHLVFRPKLNAFLYVCQDQVSHIK
jgi:hypothetical protein